MPASDAPVAVRVMTRCPSVEMDVFTGHRMRPAEMQAIKEPRSFRCAKCGAIHSWNPQTAWCEVRARFA